MDWDINTLRGLSTVFVMIAFLGVCWWAFAPRRKKRFDDAANLPFADDAMSNDMAKPDAAKNDLGSTAKPGDSLNKNGENQEGKRQD